MEESKESFFSELLSSGGEIEGLFQQKKRVGLENFTFAGAFRNLGEILPEQIATYNRRKSIQYHLVLEEVSALLHKPSICTTSQICGFNLEANRQTSMFVNMIVIHTIPS